MNNLVRIAAFLALFPSVTVDVTEPIRLRVLSYNIHHAEGVDRKLDVERISDVIRSVEPDLVALQEVDQKVKRTRSVAQPAELAQLTKMHVVFGANIELQGGHYGNAVLSRFPISKHKNHLLPNIDGSEQRGVIETEITLPEVKEPLLLLATHLDFRADELERLASAQAINDLAAGYPERPALLAGDLNASPESKTLERFSSTWMRANENTVLVGFSVENRDHWRDRDEMPHRLRGLHYQTGEQRQDDLELPAKPVLHGVSVGEGHVYVACEDGSIVCLGAQ